MKNEHWWGEYTLGLNAQKCWSIGERAIVIKRKSTEWNTWNIESVEQQQSITVSNGEHINLIDMPVMGRFLEKNTSESIKVYPLLADRPVIARPATPLTILAGERVQLFISTPIWFYAQTLPSKKSLVDLPFWRPSDSWFGSSTIDGQLCYAKYTSAKTKLDELELQPHKAITPIMVMNSDDKPLTINRINVPVNYLTLYHDDKSQLWTSGISITIEDDATDIELMIDKSIPTQFQPLTLISSPRLSLEHGKLIRRISNLFG